MRFLGSVDSAGHAALFWQYIKFFMKYGDRHAMAFLGDKERFFGLRTLLTARAPRFPAALAVRAGASRSKALE